jgi:NTP pyrophosphatase (non-canonical NTP hydrolase)
MFLARDGKTMKDLIKTLRKFNLERDWGQFHSPKNLAMALSVEVGEIVELLQWLTQEQSRNLETEKLDRVKEEIADVVIYLLMLADTLGVDPIDVARQKIEKNRLKYPVDLAKGNAKKYR